VHLLFSKTDVVSRSFNFQVVVRLEKIG